jgi:hypothetical protein
MKMENMIYYRLENGKKIAKKKIVQVGEIYGNNIEVKGGLNVGDQLIPKDFKVCMKDKR